MAAAFVQAIAGTVGSTASTTTVITVPAAGTSAGNYAVIRCNVNGQNLQPTAASDSKGNTYIVADSTGGTATVTTSAGVLVGYLATALVSGDTITVTHGSSAQHTAMADEFSGLDTNTATVVDSSNSSPASTATPTVSATMATQPDMLIGHAGVRRAFSAGQVSLPAGWTAKLSENGTTGGGGSHAAVYGAYLRVTSTGSQTYAPTLSVSAVNDVEIVGLEEAAVAAATLPPHRRLVPSRSSPRSGAAFR